MRLELSNPSIFKDAFDCIGKIIDECKIIFTEDGLEMNALDKSHITFITLNFKRTLFDEYECNTPESIIIDTTQLMNILKRCKNTDIMGLETIDNTLIITYKGDATRQFNIKLIDDEYDTPSLPNIEYNVNITLPNNIITDSLTDSALFNENLGFIIDQDYLRINSDGQFGDSHISYIHGEYINETVESHYSISMLQDIFRASKLTKECILYLGDNIPLKVEFRLPSNDGLMRFLLAPRLNEEE